MIRRLALRTLILLAAVGLASAALPAPGHADPAPAATPAGETDAAPAAGAAADDTPPPRLKLNYQQGKITLSNGLAELNVPDNFRFLDAADARKVVVNVWGNPPAAGEGVIGMLLPAGTDPADGNSWGVVISYEDDGYVKDDDANKIDYADMLKKMQQSAHEHNEARVKEGYPAMEIVGWAEPPHYDSASKKLYWAKELQIEGAKEHTLNYDMRILGRRGVLVLQAVSGMDQLADIKAAGPQILGIVNYNQGHRYADFNPKTDKVAAYGVAALVLGGIAAKAGLFKLLLTGLAAGWKFIAIGIAAVASFFKRIFGKGEKVP